MYLMNISNSPYSMAKFNNDWEEVKSFIDKHQLDGVEIILNDRQDISNIPRDIVKGIHLIYYPTWLEFYNGDRDKLMRLFSDEKDIIRYYGGLTKQCLIDTFKDEYRCAKELGVKYMVFHVAHVTNADAFRFNYEYTDKDVLDSTADLINIVFDEESDIELLFENLWWPGLKLTDYEATKDFMSKINYKNKGIMLDLSHLMITNHDIKTLTDATDYILDTVRSLNDQKDYIKGLHINKSLSGDYLRESHEAGLNRLLELSDPIERYHHISGHIKSIDMHLPYDCSSIKAIMDEINPKYSVFEFMSTDKSELDNYISIQNKCLGRF